MFSCSRAIFSSCRLRFYACSASALESALVLAAFAGFGIYQGVTAESYIGPDEIYYAYYMKHTSGPFTQESYDWLEEQGEEFAPML